jgi:hypothetical protein
MRWGVGWGVGAVSTGTGRWCGCSAHGLGAARCSAGGRRSARHQRLCAAADSWPAAPAGQWPLTTARPFLLGTDSAPPGACPGPPADLLHPRLCRLHLGLPLLHHRRRQQPRLEVRLGALDHLLEQLPLRVLHERDGLAGGACRWGGQGAGRRWGAGLDVRGLRKRPGAECGVARAVGCSLVVAAWWWQVGGGAAGGGGACAPLQGGSPCGHPPARPHAHLHAQCARSCAGRSPACAGSRS